jgi:DNA-binding IclR family transcriptional regulator
MKTIEELKKEIDEVKYKLYFAKAGTKTLGMAAIVVSVFAYIIVIITVMCR